jgi:hypothetical protein
MESFAFDFLSMGPFFEKELSMSFDLTTALIKTKTFWGVTVAALPWMTDLVSQLAGTPNLPHGVAVALGAAGSVLALVGRIAANKTVTGLLKA